MFDELDVCVQCTVLLQEHWRSLNQSLKQSLGKKLADPGSSRSATIMVNRYFRNHDILMQACQSLLFKGMNYTEYRN